MADAAASVFVISADDIRRSGATTLPEALRLAPNLNVARADANQYAISARGFNSVLANKMLVLIDGRTVYSIGFEMVENRHRCWGWLRRWGDGGRRRRWRLSWRRSWLLR